MIRYVYLEGLKKEAAEIVLGKTKGKHGFYFSKEPLKRKEKRGEKDKCQFPTSAIRLLGRMLKQREQSAAEKGKSLPVAFGARGVFLFSEL